MTRISLITTVIITLKLITSTTCFITSLTTTSRKLTTRTTTTTPTTPTTTTPIRKSPRLFQSNPQKNYDFGTDQITSTLSLLDAASKKRQRRRTKNDDNINDWIPLIINDDDDDTTTTTTNNNNMNNKKNTVYLYTPNPPTTTPPQPSHILLFLGGAGLGTLPHVAYSTLLQRISKRMNAAILTAPYDVTLDHLSLAKTTGLLLLERAVSFCQKRYGWDDDEKCRKWVVGHSLGAKLLTVYAGAMGGTTTVDRWSGLGLISFNNFGFADSITMARSFVRDVDGGGAKSAASSKDDPTTDAVFDTLINFATQAVAAVGVEFTPSPEKMTELIRRRFLREWQSKTRLFCFDDDDLDNSRDFVDACCGGNGGGDLTVSGLPGTHLTPVYWQFDVEDVLPDDDDDDDDDDNVNTARDLFGRMTGDFQSVSFGNEENLNQLVTEICSWMEGGEVSRGPVWERSDERRQLKRGPYLVTGDVIDAQIED